MDDWISRLFTTAADKVALTIDSTSMDQGTSVHVAARRSTATLSIAQSTGLTHNSSCIILCKHAILLDKTSCEK